MAFELKDGSGFIFKNKNKTSEKSPEYQGEFKTPSGELLQIALWVKSGEKGSYFSASIQEKKEAPPKEKPKEKKQSIPEPDDLPF